MNSPILKKVKRIYTEKYGIEPVVSAIHAGLECGIIGKNIPDMDMISFGPDIFNPHCPDEKVTISSVQKFYDFLIHLLAS
jgi:dipeptidase D